MSEINPYAAPLAETPAVAKLAMDGGIYHALNGSVLVIDKRAQLPTEICIKSNTKASDSLVRKLYWHHPAVYIALAFNILIYAIIAMILTKKATIYIGMSDEWFGKRRLRLLATWLAIFTAGGMFAIGLMNMIDSNSGGEMWLLLLLGGLLLFIVAAVAGIISTRMVHPMKITDTHIFLRGVNRDFARRYPPWPGAV